MSIKKIEKPSDNKLRHQLGVSKSYFGINLVVVVMGIIGYLITEELEWLLLSTLFFLLIAINQVRDTQDKIRLEIREIKRGNQ